MFSPKKAVPPSARALSPRSAAKPPSCDGYPPVRYAWYTVFLLLIIYTISFIDRQIVGLMGPVLIEEFALTKTEFGLLGGLSFALFYTVFGLFFARIADRASRTKLIATGLTLWSLMTALSGFAQSYIQLFMCRMGVGVGEATLAPAANSLLADTFPKGRLSTALSVYSMGIPIGSALAFIIGGQVIAFTADLPDFTNILGQPLKAWQKGFLIVGLPGLILTFFILKLKEPARKGLKSHKESMPLKDVIAYVKEYKTAYAGIILGVSFIAFIGFGSALWLPTFFTTYHNMSITKFANIYGSIAIVSGPAGLLLGGMFADRFFSKGRYDAHIIALLMAPIGLCLPVILLPFINNLTIVWILLFFSTLFIYLPSGVAYASLQLISPNRMRGQIVAFYVLMTNIVGYAGGPYFIGAIADLIGGEDGLRYGLSAVGLVGAPLSIIFLLRGRKAFARVLKSLEEFR